MPVRVPAKQTAAWLAAPGPAASLALRDDIDIPVPGPEEVLIKLICTGVCHSDVAHIHGNAPMHTDVPGHEGVGDVVDLGSGVSADWHGERVGVRWQWSTCGECEICQVNSVSCPNERNTGRHVRGTFAQYITAPAAHLARIPRQIEPQMVAPLLCAGITMFSALRKASLSPGQWVVIPGAGGGLGHLGVQLAHHLGYKVIAIDTGAEKAELCYQLGAAEFLDFKTDTVLDRVKALTNGYGAHAVIVTAGSQAAYQQATEMVRNQGSLICVGLPSQDFPLPLSPFQLVIRGLRVIGSSVGTQAELDELLRLAETGAIKPRIERYPMSEVNTVIGKLQAAKVSGKVVLDVAA